MKKRVLFLILLICMIFIFTACTNNKDAESDDAVPQGISLVIIAGNHANANTVSDAATLRKMENLIAKAFEYWKDESTGRLCAQGRIAVIVSDGRPTVTPILFDGEKADLFCNTSNNENNRDMLVNKMVDGIINFIDSNDLRAEEEEVDLLGAITEAKAVLKRNPGTENHILIMDTGICTTGLFDMTENDIQQGSAEEVINRIPEAAFPDLNGIKVTFKNLGNVCRPQKVLRNDSSFIKKVEDIWSLILVDKCKADLSEDIVFGNAEGEPMMYLEDSAEGYPYVKTVAFQIIEIEKTVFDSSALGFVGDSSEFIDNDQAEYVIGSVADIYRDYLNDSSDNRLYVVGSTAKTSPEGEYSSEPLADERAQKVTEILSEKFGLPADQIFVINAGTTKFSWRNNEEFPDGKLDDTAQQNNRVVAIIPDGCEKDISELESKGYIK